MVNLKRWVLWLVLCTLMMNIDAQPSRFIDSIQNKNYDPSILLWYDQPAKIWNDALPVGNGRLGAMVFGDPLNERIQFNEETYWTGGPYSSVVKGGHQYLKEVQNLVFEGEWFQAQKLFGQKLMGYPIEQQKYQSLADLVIEFEGKGETKNYKRWLDLATGIINITYERDGVNYFREIFASVPDQVIAIRLTADQPLSLSASLRGVRNQDHSNYATDYFDMEIDNNKQMVLTGKSADYLGIEGKLKYEARVKSIVDGGQVSVKDDYLVVKNANSVIFYFAAATNFVSYRDVSGDEHQRVKNYFKRIENKGFSSIKSDQLSFYQPYFNRSLLKLPPSKFSYLTTDKRLLNSPHQNDPSLAGLAYNFAKYILITSSMPGSQAANLQGIWNQDQDPMWDSKYTTNINLQMNYWMAPASNLAEFSEPLYQLVRNVSEEGRKVAKEHYACRGWVLHQNTDIWMVAAPMDGPTWGTFTTGGAWLCNQLFDQYLFTYDKDYLVKIFPLIEGSVEFFMDFLVKQPHSEWYVTNPSNSPENFPDRPGNGRFFDQVTGSYIPGTNICAGASMDMQIIRELFDSYIKASEILSKKGEFLEDVKQKRSLLIPTRIGKDGSLQEWAEDWGQTEESHRHVSGLYGLYPGNEFTYDQTPEFMEASKKVLLQRGDGSTEWSRAWKVCLWARLADGDHALRVLKGYFKDECHMQLFSGRGKVMQIDGTMGVAAGILEMLVQSHVETISLLPALPQEWESGKLEGVAVRGGFVLDFSWVNHKIKSLSVSSKKGGVCSMKIGEKIRITNNGKKVKYQVKPGNIIAWQTEPGEVYQIVVY